MMCKCRHPSNIHEDKIAYRGKCSMCNCQMFDVLINRPTYPGFPHIPKEFIGGGNFGGPSRSNCSSNSSDLDVYSSKES